MAHSIWTNPFRTTNLRRKNRKAAKIQNRAMGLESLGLRITPAINAFFNPGSGILNVIGDNLDNTIIVSRNASGRLIVNGGAVSIFGGQATVISIQRINVFGFGGNDFLSLNEALGPMPASVMFGGLGNDTLSGGSGVDGLFGDDGDDSIHGKAGNDGLFGGAGDDTFQWDLGDGSDVVEGRGGSDRLLFNGSNVEENISIAANGRRLKVTRDVADITLDVAGVERVDVNPEGGADAITVDDLTGTSVTTVNINLASGGAGDSQPDRLTINGTSGRDAITVSGSESATTISGLAATVSITGAEPSRDQLSINALAGNDVIEATKLNANSIELRINGGADNDVLVGGSGNDFLFGGDGNDMLIGGAGDDWLFGEDGDDILLGGLGIDVIDGGLGRNIERPD